MDLSSFLISMGYLRNIYHFPYIPNVYTKKFNGKSVHLLHFILGKQSKRNFTFYFHIINYLTDVHYLHNI